jgi:amino acid adenylation domain-containing protein
MSVNYSSLYELFEDSARRFPDHKAISLSNGKSVRYSQLLEDTQEIAHWLLQLGLNKQERVLLIGDKHPLVIAHLLAILACKCCVIPTDESISPDRLEFLINDLKPQVILSAQKLESEPVYNKGNWKMKGEFGLFAYINESISPHSENLAYTLFTSGSTGKPKGVTLTHQNILSFLEWAQNTFHFSSEDVFAGIAPLYFDLSLLDIFGAFMCGGCVSLYTADEVSNVRQLAKNIANHRITTLYTTPSTLRLLQQFGGAAKQQYPHIKRVLFAGEVFDPKALHQWMQQLPQARFYNLYGPTESNVCTWHEIERPVDETRTQPYPIGKACNGMHLRIHESTGELLIAGPQLTPGYWNRDALNSEKFSEAEGKIWYHSGDRVRLENGNYVYEGRTDRMLKKRGYRIEPEQVEHVLLQFESVREAAVIGGMDNDGYAFLAAFVALNTPPDEMLLALKDHCAAHLPHYMIPERIIFIPQLPKTGSGKIDYQALKQQL